MLQSSTIDGFTMVTKGSKPRQLERESNHSKTSATSRRSRQVSGIPSAKKKKAHHRKVLEASWKVYYLQ